MTVAIHYAQPTSGLSGAEIFGLDVAVNNLMRAWFRHGAQEKYLIRPTDEASYAHCESLAQEAGLNPKAKLLGLDPRYPAETLSKIHCLVRPDPLIGELAWLRRQIPGAGYALCGLIHTMSGERIARTVGELCVAPTADTDALICPSHAIKNAVQSLWEIYADYLGHRFGTQFRCPVELPVIPLGVDAASFASRTTPQEHTRQRAALQASDDEIILLFLGRLSFATKAHPAPLFLAAEQAARQSGKTIRLVMFGYFKPEMMADAFKKLGADFCQKVKLEFIANNDARFPHGLWAGADIFISLVENIQESFGLTPIEAMASGLPVIVTDWDGYRDAVRDGQDGFVIPTTAPPLETGLAIGNRYFNALDNYGEYLTAAAQSTAVDISRTAQAIQTLAEDAALRQKMGTSGKQRVAETYDWRHIIAAYSALWTELGQRRRRAPPPCAFPDHWPAAHPAYPNPYAMFAGFPSATLTPELTLRLVAGADIGKILRHEMNYFVPDLLLDKAGLAALAQKCATPQRIGDLLAGYPAAEREKVWRSCGWLLKFGVCTLDAA
jgi:alpha-maltose-1-phosphate synthase